MDYIRCGGVDYVSENDLREALGIIDEYVDIIGAIRMLREERDELKEKYDRLYISYEKAYRAKFTKLSEERERYKRLYEKLKNGILKVYREIFDCSNGDPEGTNEETLQDILTEYKRTLELKDAAEEKTIRYKQLARENEEKAARYKVRLDNAERQLRWTEGVSRTRLEKYEKLKSELDEMTKSYGESVITGGGLCEDLTKEREKVKRIEQKLIEIQDICER